MWRHLVLLLACPNPTFSSGEVGGWSASPQLGYQIVGIFGCRIKAALTLQAGFRYLSVDRRNGRALINTHIDTVTSGALIGISIQLK